MFTVRKFIVLRILIFTVLVSIKIISWGQCSGLGTFISPLTFSSTTSSSVNLSLESVFARIFYSALRHLQGGSSLTQQETNITTNSPAIAGLLVNTNYEFLIEAVKTRLDEKRNPVESKINSNIVSVITVPEGLTFNSLAITYRSYVSARDTILVLASYNQDISASASFPHKLFCK
jgi:hypothetical protein